MSDRAFDVARASGLIREGEPLVVLLSGGADSVCLLDVAVRLGADLGALHVNYGLRPGSDADEQFCRVVAHYVSVPGPAIPDREVTSLDPSELPQTVFERGHARLGLRVVGNQTHQHADPPDALRLRAASGNAATAPPRSVMNSRRL